LDITGRTFKVSRMDPLPPRPGRLRSIGLVVASSALVALSIHLALRAPWIGAVLGVIALLVIVPQIRARRRMRRLLLSGDVEAVLSAWETALERTPQRDTLLPLVRATALAANGMTERARDALSRALPGPAWDAAIEQRLLVETMLDAFEGERDLAISKAERLASLPLPSAGPLLRERIALARDAISALARAFAHRSRLEDLRVLLRAARKNPLIHWPLRYAAAVVCIDHSRRDEARRMLEGAPTWPDGSAFRDFHAELVERSGD
jgi:hypothetical protein